MKNFQLITIIVFIGLAILGVLVFSGKIPLGNTDEPGSQGTVILWGSVRSDIMNPLVEEFNLENPSFVLKYVQKDIRTFDGDLLEALASGTGPDLVFMPDNLAFHYKNKIAIIPFTTYPISTFKNNFASASEVFLTSKGILAFPLTIDPLMLFYNRSILDTNAIVYPPSSWDDLVSLIPILTKKDNTNKINKSAVAMGHFSNVNNAKNILTTLFMQNGSNIVFEKDGAFFSNLKNTNLDLDLVLKFYTDFADPNNILYSWNKSFSNANDVFSKEDSVFYFGFASEIPYFINKNPNHNFFIAPIPQNKNKNTKLTNASVMGISLLSSSKNFNTAFTALNKLTTGIFASKLSLSLGIAPARRDLLQKKPIDLYSPIIYDSALFSKSFLDPSLKDTNDIFRKMIEGVISGAFTTRDAIVDGDDKLNILLTK